MFTLPHLYSVAGAKIAVGMVHDVLQSLFIFLGIKDPHLEPRPHSFVITKGGRIDLLRDTWT